MGRLASFIFSAAVVATAGCNGSIGSTLAPVSSAPRSIQHIVILVQENRSFDNLFMGFPGADTTLQGLCKAGPAWCKVAHEVPLKAIPLAEGSPSLGGKDIDHSHQCFELECDPDSTNVCRNDGFDLIDKGESQGGPPAKLYPYAYVRRSDEKHTGNSRSDTRLQIKCFSPRPPRVLSPTKCCSPVRFGSTTASR